jgi:hypothetical protein
MPDGAHDKVKLNVRVPPSKKQEWKESLDDGETLSSLVRRAVDKEVRDEYVSTSTLDDLGGRQEIDLSEVTERLETLQGLVESLQRQIDLESIDETPEPTGQEIADLAMEIIEHIPTYRDINSDLRRMARKVDDEVEAYKSTIEYAQQNEPSKLPKGTVTEIAAKAREDDDQLVWHALVYLEHQTTEPVESVSVGGQRYWIRGV